MIQKKALLVQSASRSLIPFAIGSTSYLLKGLVSQNSFLDQITDLSFGVYTNYFGFLLVMLLIDIIFRISQKSRTTQASLDLEQQGIKNLGSFNGMMKSLAASIISYSLIFAAFYLIAAMVFTAAAAPVAQKSQAISTRFNAPRMLEEQAPPVEKISLTIGNVLSTLNIDVTAMVLSKDKKIAFTTVNYYGTLKIIDISNENYPNVISSLALKQTGSVFKIKTLALSSDEKTLYVSNSRDLEIIDISNIEAPVLLSFTSSPLFDDMSYLNIETSFRTSLAINEKTKTVYIGGLGLQIFDISDPKSPGLLRATRNNRAQRNELCLVQEKSILLMAKENLDAYDISNPKSLKLLYSFPVNSTVHSLLLSDDSKTVFLLGRNSINEVTWAQVDISNSGSPVLVSQDVLEGLTKNNTGLLAVSPDKTKFYFYVDESKKYNLYVFDAFQRVYDANPASLIDNVYALAFAHDGKTIVTGSKNQFIIIELIKDFPNSQILGPTPPESSFNLPSSYSGLKITPDGKLLFVMRSVTQGVSPRSYDVLDIYDLTEKNSPQLLGTYKGDQSFIMTAFASDFNTAYLLGRQSLYAVDLTDRTNPVRTNVYHMKDPNIIFSGFIPSVDGKTGFIITQREDASGNANITFFNFTDSLDIEGFYTINKTFSASNVRIVRDRANTLIVIDKEIDIYDISNIAAPVLLSSLPIGDHEISPYASSARLSTDKNTLYLQTYNDNQFTSLKIYDLTNLKSPSLLSDFALPKFDPQTLRPPFFLSRDQQSGFIFQDNSLLKLNLSNLNSPVVVGSFSLSTNKTEKINTVGMSDDGRFAVSITNWKQVKIFDLIPQNTLYLKQEKFSLGQKSSGTVSILRRSSLVVDYWRSDQSQYKIIKLSLVDIKIAPNLFTLESTTTPLPSWITFDKEAKRLTVEPKNQADLGSYMLQATTSTQVLANAFNGLVALPGSPEDLFTSLMSLGYVDIEFFLTANFGSYEKFFLPIKYASYKAQIYNILREYYFETSTGFSVVSSLSFKHTQGESLTVSTLSTNNVVLDIKLYPYSADSQVKFLSKQYDLILASLLEAKSRIILEGPLVDVNAALKSIIVDLTGNSTTSYDAYVTVSDGLNPIYTTYMANANQYFLHNEAPIQNSHSSVQEQIERISIATGQYFNIQLDPNTFIDKNGNELSYQLEMQEKTAEIPSWLVFEKLTLHGTAPEDITGRSLKMVLAVKNEFKEVSVPFTLNVKLTAMTVIKLIAKIAFILMMVVLAVSTIRSCGKKEDEKLPRDSKEYLLRRNLNKDGTYEAL